MGWGEKAVRKTTCNQPLEVSEPVSAFWTAFLIDQQNVNLSADVRFPVDTNFKGIPSVVMGLAASDPSSETQGQIKGARESLNGRKNIYGTKKSKEWREEPLGTMSYQTSSKRSPPFWLLIGARKLVFFWHQSEARTVATVWNWSGKTSSPGALLAVLYFSSCHIFPPV